ncbi:MAG TPA: hypothetical protein VFE33_25100 [Thermoanaerobaculia bacterium]|nr:hypothetical protein [Thermoanaerobaculia bacterium]
MLSSPPPPNTETLRRFSWAATVLSVLYILWAGQRLGEQRSAMVGLVAGLGGTLPRATQIVLGVSPTWRLAVEALLIAALLVKEVRLKDPLARLATTLVLFILATWLHDFLLTALFQPLWDTVNTINS